MAIEKLDTRELWYYMWVRQWCSPKEVKEKINEIIDYLNSQDHIVESNEMVEQEFKTLRDALKWLAFRDAEVDQIMDVVKKHQWVEQEPNKVELVPLDVDGVTKEIMINLFWSCNADTLDKKNTKKITTILSKYWVPTPKKFTKDDAIFYTEWFLRMNNLLEE